MIKPVGATEVIMPLLPLPPPPQATNPSSAPPQTAMAEFVREIFIAATSTMLKKILQK
jgi:hypothetical protein